MEIAKMPTRRVLIGSLLLAVVTAGAVFGIERSGHRHPAAVITFKSASDRGGPATQRQEAAVELVISSSSRVVRSVFVSRAAAFTMLVHRLEARGVCVICELLYNPLPDSIHVTLRDAGALIALERRMHPMPPGVQNIAR
jgi:cell division protein FtsX